MFRLKYFGIEPRIGHAVQFDASLLGTAIKLFDYPGSPLDSNGQLRTVSAAMLSEGYLNGILAGFVFETNNFSGIYFGSLFESLDLDTKNELRGKYGDVLNTVKNGMVILETNSNGSVASYLNEQIGVVRTRQGSNYSEKLLGSGLIESTK